MPFRFPQRSFHGGRTIDAYSLDSLPADDGLSRDPTSVRFRSIAEILLRGIKRCVANDRDLNAEALTAAGINLANVTRHRPKNLDRDAMLLWIRNRKESGQSFTFSEVCLENRDYALAIKREFGSWARALEAAFPTSDEGL
jgi:hypothetical protein